MAVLPPVGRKHVESYWNRTNISRRRALSGLAAAGGGIAALSLVGCGGGDDDKPASGASTQQVTDSTKGKPGGTLKIYIQNYPASFSAVATQQTYQMIAFAHAALLQHAWGVASVDSYDFYKYEPDIAGALPEQPDDITLTFKI